MTNTFFSNIKDPPIIDEDALGKFSKAVVIKAGENAEWKMPFSGGAPMTIQWYKDDDELLPALNVKIETSANESKLRLVKCQRTDGGEVKIKIKNEFGTTEAISKLIVLGELSKRDPSFHTRVFPCFPCTTLVSFHQQTNPRPHRGRWTLQKVP